MAVCLAHQYNSATGTQKANTLSLIHIYLREILLTAATGAANSMTTDAEAARKLQTMVQVIKYGVIVVSTLPILCVYPFLQKYFVKGVMIGSIKG